MSDDIHETRGPVLLLAGPGTGKTHRLGKRIKYLIDEKGISSEEITVITFTAAAAKNMRDRISDEARPELYIEPRQQPKNICTMHSLGFRILQDELAALKFNCESVVTSPELQRLLCEDGAQIIGLTRSQAEETTTCRRLGNCERAEQDKCAICREYKQLLRACSAIDYDDQILLTCSVLRRHPDLLEKYQAQCRHLLVDEYQDINWAQFDLIRLLSQRHPDGLFVVGDDDQSIYSWRGGSPEFIRRFKEDFGDMAKVKALKESFRCHPHILEGATCVISSFDEGRIKKGPFSYKVTNGPKIQVHSAASDKKEAMIVRSIIKSVLPSRDVLILVPHRGFATAVCKALLQARIPFTAPPAIPGEGLPTIATLGRWLRNPNDGLCLRLCLQAFIDNNPAVPSSRVRTPKKKQEREILLKEISELWKPVLSEQANDLWASLVQIKNKSRLLKEAHEAFTNLLALLPEENASAFISSVIDALGVWKTPTAILDEANAWNAFFEQASPQGQGDSVRIMTLQGAKGLEARVVCVLGLEEGTLPRDNSDSNRLAEEARLFYVSATRAVDELHLFHARKRSGSIVFRNLYKGAGVPDLVPSRFITYIEKAHKEDRFHRA